MLAFYMNYLFIELAENVLYRDVYRYLDFIILPTSVY